MHADVLKHPERGLVRRVSAGMDFLKIGVPKGIVDGCLSHLGGKTAMPMRRLHGVKQFEDRRAVKVVESRDTDQQLLVLFSRRPDSQATLGERHCTLADEALHPGTGHSDPVGQIPADVLMHQEGMHFRYLGYVHRLEHQPRRCDDVLHAMLFDVYHSACLEILSPRSLGSVPCKSSIASGERMMARFTLARL